MMVPVLVRPESGEVVLVLAQFRDHERAGVEHVVEALNFLLPVRTRLVSGCFVHHAKDEIADVLIVAEGGVVPRLLDRFVQRAGRRGGQMR
jgi:hypothetical protein